MCFKSFEKLDIWTDKMIVSANSRSKIKKSDTIKFILI